MITDAEKTRLKKLFSDTISLLCRSGLPGACAHRVDALIGVTLDNQEVVLVNFSENFLHENECSARDDVTDKKNSDTHSIQAPEQANTSVTCSYGVKDEYKASTIQDLYNTSVLGPDVSYGTDVTTPNLHDDSHNRVEHMKLQVSTSVNPDSSGIDGLLSESKKTLALESDSDCVLIKTELQEGGAELNNIPAENEMFIPPSANGTVMPSMPAAHRCGSSLRIKHVRGMQRHTRCSPFQSKFYRPHQRYYNMEHNASDSSQVIYTNKYESTFSHGRSPTLTDFLVLRSTVLLPNNFAKQYYCKR